MSNPADDEQVAAQAARQAVQALLRGEAPALGPAATYGRWKAIVYSLVDARTQGGTDFVVRAFNAIVRAHPALAHLMAGALLPGAGGLPTRAATIPALPAAAAAVMGHAAPCGRWLDAYVAFAQEAAPMTPRSFHEAAGLFVASVAIGRRLVFYHGLAAFYPNLYCLWLGPTTL